VEVCDNGAVSSGPAETLCARNAGHKGTKQNAFVCGWIRRISPRRRIENRGVNKRGGQRGGTAVRSNITSHLM